MTHVAYMDIGNELRSARREHGCSVEELARRMHIRAKYLYALEAGDLSQLPGVAYARGYLLRYADALGLHVPDMAAQFDAAGEVRREFFVPQAATANTKPHRMLIVVCSVLALLMMWQWRSLSLPVSLVEPPPAIAEGAAALVPAAGNPCLLSEASVDCLQQTVTVSAPFYPAQPVASVLDLDAFYRSGGR